MAFLFDTDAISETMRPHPLPEFLDWIRAVPRAEQFTSAVAVGELLKGIHLLDHADAGRESGASTGADASHLAEMFEDVLSRMTVISFDLGTAHVFGAVAARLQTEGRTLAVADLQIAATALHHDLELVTGNVRHFERVPGLRISRCLVDARQRR